MAAWMEISSSSQTNRLSLIPAKSPAVNLAGRHLFFLSPKPSLLFSWSLFLWSERNPTFCTCMCGKISVCVGEIISEADTWPLFEKWNRSQLYNITAIERQSDVNWIWAMTFLCSYSAERLSNFPFLSVSLPLSSVSVTLIFSFFLYHQLAHFLTIPNMYLLHPGPISFELILQH